MKILFTASRSSHIINFHLSYLEYFKKNGDGVHVITHGKVKEAGKSYDAIFEKK